MTGSATAPAPRSPPPSPRPRSTTSTPRSGGSPPPRCRCRTPSRSNWPPCPTPGRSPGSSARSFPAGEALTETARESHDLTTRARARKLTPDELAGGTFTISNLGMYGIRQFTAVINPPQAAILAVGEAVRQPVVHGNQVAIATTMALTVSIDHRAVDGATAARFLTRLRQLIEEPVAIVL